MAARASAASGRRARGDAALPEPAGQPDTEVNEVVLVGRLAAGAEERALPSGDRVVQFRVVVRREGSGTPSRSRAISDALECVAWRADARRSVLSWRAGDVVEVHGSLRRRFWRGTSGVASRSEVEAVRVRRLGRASA